jgi:hypothetical protein
MHPDLLRGCIARLHLRGHHGLLVEWDHASLSQKYHGFESRIARRSREHRRGRLRTPRLRA